MPVPTVACVQGVAAGAGASLALNCDLVVAGQSAAFLQAFGKVGLLPDTGATSLLPRLIGRARSLGLMMLGDKLPAEEAQRMGLIWACVPDADLGATVATLANRLAAMPSRALAQTRAAVDAAPHMPLEALLAMEVRVQRELGASADYQEGVAAFAAKRAPVFKDR